MPAARRGLRGIAAILRTSIGATAKMGPRIKSEDDIGGLSTGAVMPALDAGISKRARTKDGAQPARDARFETAHDQTGIGVRIFEQTYCGAGVTPTLTLPHRGGGKICCKDAL